MKKINYIVALLFVFLLSCSQDDFLGEQNGQGTLSLKVGMCNKVQVSTRSTSALTSEMESALIENCKIRIYDGTTLIRKFQGTSEIPQEGVKMVSGHYKATIEAGDSVAASFDKQYYVGSKEFDITSGGRSEVALKGYIRNAVVKVIFDASSMNEVYSDYQAEIGSEEAKLIFTKSEAATQRGYYMLSKDVDSFNYVLSVTTSDGQSRTYSGEALSDLRPSTLYTLKFKYKETEQVSGGAYVDIEVEEEPLDAIESPVLIYQRPVYTGLYDDDSSFNTQTPLMLEPGYSKKISMYVSFSAPAVAMSVSCVDFPKWSVSETSDLDLFNMTEEGKLQLAEKGLNFITRNVTGDGAIVGFEFSPELIGKITSQEGSHEFHFDACDEKGGQRTLNWIVNISNSTVVTEDLDVMDVYATRAVLRGSVSKEPQGVVTFQYRALGSSTWESISAQRSESSLSASLTGLKPGTDYEYRVLDGGTPSSIVCRFMTEQALQPENASFEDWSGSSPLLMCANGQQRWWDSGNHGSATMNVNVTYNSSEFKHSGKYSAKLASQFVGVGPFGKFAAGNAFVGQYIRTDGTDGVLGWGRPFASRPKALRGYIKYVSKSVNYPCEYIQKGAPDQGQIFVALGDWSGEQDGNQKWPVIVRTKDKHLFDQSQNNRGTIAYGQQTWTASTPGEGLIEFIIPLDYWRTDSKPQSLLLVCTASKYGDYFSGGAGSTMWIDDLEFVYD